jgi:ADP-heptose:LPS heptosyltransferase
MILLSPFSRPLRNNEENPKNYVYWKELVNLLEEKDEIVQIGYPAEEKLVKDFRGELSLKQVFELIGECKFWISVDNMLQHMAKHVNKRGVVLWGVSNPNLFGYRENLNIFKDVSFFRPNQFETWEQIKMNREAFVLPKEAMRRMVEAGFFEFFEGEV